MSYRILPASDSFWRPSNQMGVMNTDLAKQLQAATLGARLWRLAPGQASTRHRHRHTHELYLLILGTGRIRIGDDLHTLEMTDETLAWLYPNGPKALPPELKPAPSTATARVINSVVGDASPARLGRPITNQAGS